MTTIFFGFVYQNLNGKKYDELVALGLGTALAYYVSIETMGSYNISLQNFSEIGLGRSLDYQFLALYFLW